MTCEWEDTKNNEKLNRGKNQLVIITQTPWRDLYTRSLAAASACHSFYFTQRNMNKKKIKQDDKNQYLSATQETWLA